MKQLHRWKLYFDKDLEESWLNQLAAGLGNELLLPGALHL